jgi:hypothetical protein
MISLTPGKTCTTGFIVVGRGYSHRITARPSCAERSFDCALEGKTNGE